MAKGAKKLGAMKANPKADWTIADLETVARRHGVAYDHEATSHVTFRAPNGARLTVPARRPVKPFYVREFVKLIESLEGNEL